LKFQQLKGSNYNFWDIKERRRGKMARQRQTGPPTTTRVSLRRRGPNNTFNNTVK